MKRLATLVTIALVSIIAAPAAFAGAFASQAKYLSQRLQDSFLAGSAELAVAAADLTVACSSEQIDVGVLGTLAAPCDLLVEHLRSGCDPADDGSEQLICVGRFIEQKLSRERNWPSLEASIRAATTRLQLLDPSRNSRR